MSELSRHRLLLIAIAATVFFVNLGEPRLWDRDEPRNAGCAVEMLDRGDWVTPYFNDEIRTHKPVLLYWLIMSAYSVFGVTEFAARLWSALLAIGTVLCTYHIGRRLFSPRVGFWAGIVLASSLMFDVAARAATPDSVLIFFGAAAIAVYVHSTFAAPQADSSGRPRPVLKVEGRYFPTHWRPLVAMYALMGMGVLAKGPVGLVLPTAVIGMFLLIMRLPADAASGGSETAGPGLTASRRWRAALGRLLRPFAPRHFFSTCRVMRPGLALLVVALVAGPWYVWVTIRTGGAWTEGFFLEHNFGRASAAMEGHSGLPVIYYVVAVLVGFFPWSVLAGPVAIDLVRRGGRRDAWRPGQVLALCWIGVYVGLFSLAQTKLPSYVTPMYPALALLTAVYLDRWVRGRVLTPEVWSRLAWGSLVVAGVGLCIAFPIVASRYLPGDELIGLVGLAPLAGGCAALVLSARGRPRQAVTAMAAAAVVFVVGMFGFVAVRADRHQENDRLLAAIERRSISPLIAAHGRLEPTWVFYSGHAIVQLDTRDLHRNSRFWQNSENPFVITTAGRYRELKKHLPRHVGIIARARYFLKDEELLLLGREDSFPIHARRGGLRNRYRR